jgi:hypothetical protein
MAFEDEQQVCVFYQNHQRNLKNRDSVDLALDEEGT